MDEPKDRLVSWLLDEPPGAPNPMSEQIPPLSTPLDIGAAPDLKCLKDVEPKPIEWLWEGRIALGKV